MRKKPPVLKKERGRFFEHGFEHEREPSASESAAESGGNGEQSSEEAEDEALPPVEGPDEDGKFPAISRDIYEKYIIDSYDEKRGAKRPKDSEITPFLENELAKKYLKRKDRRFWNFYNGCSGGVIRYYLINEFKLEGFEKEIGNCSDDWTEIIFRMIEK